MREVSEGWPIPARNEWEPPDDVSAATPRLNYIANLVGLPGLAIPCGFDEDGLPLSLQICGSSMDDQAVLDLGMGYQRETDWHPEAARSIPGGSRGSNSRTARASPPRSGCRRSTRRRSGFPPEHRRAPGAGLRPGRRAAPSTTTLARVMSQSIASKICASGRVTISSHEARHDRAGVVADLLDAESVDEAIDLVQDNARARPRRCASSPARPRKTPRPTMRTPGLTDFAAIETPEMRPPPPMGTIREFGPPGTGPMTSSPERPLPCDQLRVIEGDGCRSGPSDSTEFERLLVGFVPDAAVENDAGPVALGRPRSWSGWRFRP